MIFGHYELVRAIGEGGFSRTYEARHIYLDERACLKQNKHLGEEETARLRREAKLLWDLNHYSLPALRDFFTTEDDGAVLVMQYIDGEELRATLCEHDALAPETLCWILQRLLNALYYLHGAGVVHGDIKPANIILQPQTHNAVLVDLGQAAIRPKAVSKATGYTMVYAAPELLAGKPPLPASDLYSLALTALTALGGDPHRRTFPRSVPHPLKAYLAQFFDPDPLKRPDWEQTDLIRALSDLRFELFERRSTR